MGALSDGFDAARKEHDDRIAERQRKEQLADRRLEELGQLLDLDAAMMAEHGITHETSNRTLHVSHKRSPIAAIHFDPAEEQFRTTYMRDNTSGSAKSAEECANALGALLFNLVTRD